MDRAFWARMCCLRWPTALQQLWDFRDVQLVTSDYAIEKARRNLETDVQRVRLIERVTALEQVETRFDLSAARTAGLPAKDVSILAAAIVGHSTHLITGNVRHFAPLFGQIIHSMAVVKTADYLHCEVGSARNAWR